MARSGLPLDLLDQRIRWEREGKKGKKEERREEERRERSSTFFLEFSVIRPSVSVGTRGEVLPHDDSFA